MPALCCTFLDAVIQTISVTIASINIQLWALSSVDVLCLLPVDIYIDHQRQCAYSPLPVGPPLSLLEPAHSMCCICRVVIIVAF